MIDNRCLLEKVTGVVSCSMVLSWHSVLVFSSLPRQDLFVSAFGSSSLQYPIVSISWFSVALGFPERSLSLVEYLLSMVVLAHACECFWALVAEPTPMEFVVMAKTGACTLLSTGSATWIALIAQATHNVVVAVLMVAILTAPCVSKNFPHSCLSHHLTARRNFLTVFCCCFFLETALDRPLH